MRFYKGYRSGNGGYSGGSLEMVYSENGVRVEMRRCIGDKKFDRETRQIIALNHVEIGQILYIFEHDKNGVIDLKHFVSKTPKSILIRVTDKGTLWSVIKKGDERAITVGLSFYETRVVIEILKYALTLSGDPKNDDEKLNNQKTEITSDNAGSKTPENKVSSQDEL